MTHHLVGMAEIAEMLGVSRQRVAQLVESYADFPDPEVELSGGRVWSRTAIETWIANHPQRGKERESMVKALLGREEGGFFERFTDRARAAVVRAQEEARLLKHNYIGTEHLLLGLLALGEGVAADALARLGVTLDATRGHVREYIGEGTDVPHGHIPFTPRTKLALELSLREALKLGHNYIGTEHVLLGLTAVQEGVAWKLLSERCGLTETGLRDTVLTTLVQIPRLHPVDEVHSRQREILCSFCGKSRSQVEKLIAGAGVYICDACVRLSAEIVDEADDVPAPPGIDRAALEALQGEVESLKERLADALHRFEDPDS